MEECDDNLIVTDDEGNIIKYSCRKKVNISGNGGSVSLPKKIVNKIVRVTLEEK